MAAKPASNARLTPLTRVTSPTVLIGAAVAVLALPSAVLAFSMRLDMPPDAETGTAVHHFASTGLDPAMQRAAAGQAGKGAMFRFTPAGLVMRPDRAVTVAVRVDAATARDIIVRGIVDRPVEAPATASGLVALRIAPTAYNLGVARGYQGFAQGPQGGAGLVSTGTLAGELRKLDMPDLSTYQTADKAGPGTPSRLAPHIALDERERAGRAPRTLESVGTQTVDLGGSYRVARNLDVTAGVRYQRDRDRLQPVTDGKTDSQAVFVGTQFKF